MQECQDIDECRRQDDSLNGIFSEDVQEVPLCQNGLCVNTIGGFECQCPDQWILKVGGNCKTQNQREKLCKLEGKRKVVLIYF